MLFGKGGDEWADSPQTLSSATPLTGDSQNRGCRGGYRGWGKEGRGGISWLSRVDRRVRFECFFFWRKIFLFLREDLSTLVTKGRGGALWLDISWLGKLCRLQTNFALKGLVDSQTITFCRGKTSSSTSACIAIVSSIVSLTCCRNGMIFHVICNQRWTSSPSHAMPGQHSCAIDPDWQSQIKPGSYEIQFSESLPSAHPARKEHGLLVSTGCRHHVVRKYVQVNWNWDLF